MSGSDVDPNSLYWNTSFAGNYTDGGTGGTNTFRQDTNWAPYSPAISITTAAAVPLPASAWAGLALLGLLAGKRVATRLA